MDLHERVLGRLKAVLPARAKLLVAVSGGVDSMVLLDIMARARKSAGWQMTVAHLNHQLRGKRSDGDERLVRLTARKLQLKAVVGAADVRKLSDETKVSLEMAARNARREFLLATARKAHASHIILAHHADDQVELFFLRLMRGSGPDGLSGMRFTAGLSSEESAAFKHRKLKQQSFIVRPLLAETKRDILDYARANKIQFREDATNLSFDIARNRVRHELLPLLEANYHPFSRRNVLRTMELLRDEAVFVSSLAEHWLSAKRSSSQTSALSFGDLHPALQRRIIQVQLFEHKIEPHFQLVEELRLKPGKRISFANSSSESFVERDVAGLITLAQAEPCDFNSSEKHLWIASLTTASFSGVSFQLAAADVRRQTARNFKLQRPNFELFDALRIGPGVKLRHWQPGDRFQPIGMPKPAKLQDLFVNAKIPPAKRRSLVLGEAAGGEIFWVEGLRISERFKVTAATQKILRWKWKRERWHVKSLPPSSTPPLR